MLTVAQQRTPAMGVQVFHLPRGITGFLANFHSQIQKMMPQTTPPTRHPIVRGEFQPPHELVASTSGSKIIQSAPINKMLPITSISLQNHRKVSDQVRYCLFLG